MAVTHQVDASKNHCRWDNAIPPVVTIAPGDTVVFETPDFAGGQIGPHSTSADLANLSFDPIHTVSGPVAIEGAEPGDTLVVDVLDIVPKRWGWSAIIPGFGLLTQDDAFRTPYLQHWDLSNGKTTELKPGVVVPFEPFCGVMAVAPAEPGELQTVPPRVNGGNIDLRQIVKGATLYMPVLHPGANFSVGDVHATQGDGEVCGTAIECEATVTLRFNLLKGHRVERLSYRMPGAMTGSWNTAGWFGTTAYGPDLHVCAQQAVRDMVFYLGRAHGLTPQEALVLCSVCVDLKISEIVDVPNWIVSANLPLGVFTGGA